MSGHLRNRAKRAARKYKHQVVCDHGRLTMAQMPGSMRATFSTVKDILTKLVTAGDVDADIYSKSLVERIKSVTPLAAFSRITEEIFAIFCSKMISKESLGDLDIVVNAVRDTTPSRSTPSNLMTNATPSVPVICVLTSVTSWFIALLLIDIDKGS